MELRFVVSKQALFINALLNEAEVNGWVDLQNSLWDKYRSGYELLQGKSYKIFAFDDEINSFAKATKEIKMLIEEGLKSSQFVVLLNNAINYKKWLENEWSKNKDIVEKELTDILRVELLKTPFTVYVMGDLMHSGMHIGDSKIFWGHKEDWRSYSLVYLAHEYLHGMFSHTDLEHAIIELITDNELRIRLNGSGEYFICDGKSVGHSYLLDIEKKLYKDWQKYLLNKKTNISEFIKTHQKITK